MMQFQGSMDKFLEWIQEDKLEVVLFGAAFTAAEALQEGCIRNQVKYIVDNDTERQGRIFRANDVWLPIDSPDILSQLNTRHTVLLITSEYYREIIKQLESRPELHSLCYAVYHIVKYGCLPGSEEYFLRRYLADCMTEYENALHRRGEFDAASCAALMENERKYICGTSPDNRPLIIPRMQIITHNLCNLQCTNCCARIPTISNRNRHISTVEQCIRDLELVLESADQCINLNICPEPFMYPELKELLIYVQKQDKVVSAELFTNCISTPQKDVLDILADPKFFVSCSDYGRIRQMGATVEALEKAGVRFKIFSDWFWFDPGEIKPSGRTKEERREHCMLCPINYQRSIYNGALYSCALPSRLLDQECDYRSDHDYFLLKEDESVESRTEKLRGMIFQDSWDACDYCNQGHLPHKRVPAGEQMNGEARSKYTIIRRDELEAFRQRDEDEARRRLYYTAAKSGHPLYTSERLTRPAPDTTLVLWGTGECFFRNLRAVQSVQKVEYVSCNSPQKWGKEAAPGVRCISPDEVKKLPNAMVVIMVEDAGTCFQIANQLLDMGISKFDHVYNWLYYNKRDVKTE